MQLRLSHYNIRHRYIPLRRFRPRAGRRGLAERLIKAKLLREGWEVWRGGALNLLRSVEIYPNVYWKYQRLRRLINTQHPSMWNLLQLYCSVHYGMPDFIVYRRGELKFIECKLGHEQLNEYQRRCLPKLQALGFRVEVHKIVEECTKARQAIVNIKTGEKEILEKQLRLTKKLCARKK